MYLSTVLVKLLNFLYHGTSKSTPYSLSVPQMLTRHLKHIKNSRTLIYNFSKNWFYNNWLNCWMHKRMLSLPFSGQTSPLLFSCLTWYFHHHTLNFFLMYSISLTVFIKHATSGRSGLSLHFFSLISPFLVGLCSVAVVKCRLVVCFLSLCPLYLKKLSSHH